MIKKLILSLFIFGISILTPQNIFAHILKYDGSVGAVLHVNPEDDPIAGEPTGFFFEFKDKINKFLPENCDCLIKITKEGSEIYSQDLFKDNPNPSLTNASFSYVFPTIGAYGVGIEGKSKDGSFDNFALKYDVRVARTASNQQVVQSGSENKSWISTHIWYVILPVLIVIITGVLYISKNKK